MLYQFDFGYIKVHFNNIIEVSINEGEVFDIEVSEQIDSFVNEHIQHPFAVMVNALNSFKFTFEAKLLAASYPHLVAIAAITYNEKGKIETQLFKELRQVDALNLKAFDGFCLGREKALDWLKTELNNAEIDQHS